MEGRLWEHFLPKKENTESSLVQPGRGKGGAQDQTSGPLRQTLGAVFTLRCTQCLHTFSTVSEAVGLTALESMEAKGWQQASSVKARTEPGVGMGWVQ